jgi:putative SOS response-associated peptidase YedK
VAVSTCSPDHEPQTRWRFTLAGDDLLMIAGLVRDVPFAMLTTEPSSDMAPIHSRQMVVLPDEAAWRYYLPTGRAKLPSP